MTIPSLTNFNAGQRLSAARLQQVKEYLDWLRDRPFVLAQQTGTGTAVATGTSVAVALDSEVADDLGMHSTSTNPSRITFAEDGWWTINASVGFPGNATGDRMASLQANGTTLVARSATLATSATNPTVVQVTGVIQATAGDYIELLAYQNSGGSLTTQPVAMRTWMSAIWERP